MHKEACITGKAGDRWTINWTSVLVSNVSSSRALPQILKFFFANCNASQNQIHSKTIVNSLFLTHSTLLYMLYRYSVVPMAEMFPRLVATLMEAKKNPDHKVIVFFVAARVVQVCV